MFAIQKRSKRLKVRLSRFEQLEARQMFAAAIWSNVLQPLDVYPNDIVTPLDALLIINEINNPSYADRTTGRLPDAYNGPGTPPMIDVTCDQHVTPLDALIVINALNIGVTPPGWQFSTAGNSDGSTGRFESAACAPRLVEGSSLVTQLQSQLKVPTANSAVRVKFEAPQFDLSSNGSMRDAFEILVVDANNRPLAQPYRYGKDSSYNWSEQLPPLIAGGSQASVGSGTVFSSATINLTGLAVGTPIKVIARLLNNDHDDATSVVIHSVEFVTASGSVPSGMAPDQTNRESSPEVRFNTLTDVTSTFDVQYGRTTLTGDPSIISTDFQLTNAASLPVRGNLIAVVHSDADSTASLLNPDGFMPDGSPYLNLTNLAPQGVAPGETIASKSMQFRIQSQTRFSYRLELLSGFNQSPTIASVPAADVLVGKQSAWQLNATDPDGDVLTYSIVTGPTGLSVDVQTGRMQWTPGGADIGRWSIQVSAADRFGAKAATSFQINVRPDIPNRPPVITSTPSTDAQITSPFEVRTYPLGSGPVAADVLPTIGGLADIITANAGDQQLGMLKGQSNTLSGTQSIGIGEPAPSLYPSSFVTGLNVPIDLVPNSRQNINRDIQGVLTADVNQDSIPDVIVAATINSNGSLGNTNEAGYVIVRLGNGDGTFREGWRTALPAVSSKTNRAARIQWVDVTGDALPDLIVTELVGNQALVYPGQSTGLPAVSPIVSALTGNFIVSTQIADMNRDGRLDLVTIENQGNNGGRSGIGIQFGDGAGRFSGLTFVAAENDSGGLGYVADLDGINGPDLVRLNYNNARLETWLNDGNGQFGSMVSSDFRAYLSSTDSNGRLLNPTSAYIDDFNGDGKVDALVTGYQSVVLLSGQGNGRFGDRTEQGNKVLVVDDGDFPQWTNISQTDGRAPDVDGNGLPDFVFGDGSSEGNIMIGLQQPDHSFRITQYNSFFNDDTGIGTKKSGQGNPYVVIADFNRDGINDALTATLSDSTQPASVGIFLGDKPGTLRAPNFVNSYSATDYRVDRGRGGFSVAGDFDNDGHEDIVTAAGTRFDQAFFFAAGHGDGSFEPYQIASSLINSVNSLKAVDIDRDGNLDLVWIDGSNSGAAFGLGNGAFQMMPGLILDGSQPSITQQALQVSDFNADGYPDVVMRLQTGNIDTNFQTRMVVLLYNPTNRRFDRLSDNQNLLTSSPRRGGYYLDESLGLGDLNNDGQSEFFTYSAPIDSGVPGRFTIFQRRSTFGSDVSDFFTKTVIENPDFIPNGASIYSYVVDDFNHDGLNDLACSLNDARLEVLTGTGNFQFRDATFYVTNGPLIEGGDFNGDGVTDIASMWASGFISFSVRPFASVLYGRTDGSFAPQTPISSSTDTTFSPVVGDFNGDGASDLTGLGGLKNLEAFVSRPTGLVDLVTGDLNGDGDADVVSVSQDFSRVKVLLKKTDQTFSRQPDLLTDTLPVDVQLVQADSDGLLDIVTANKVGTSLSLFTHSSANSFTRQDIDLPVVPDKVTVGDLNGDGIDDLVVVSRKSNAIVGLIGDRRSYTVSFTLPIGFEAADIAMGDVTGDGKADIVLSDETGDRIVVLAGQGNSSFDTPTFIPGINGPTSLGLADMNADGRLDILASQAESDQLGILFNRGSGRFTNPQTIRLGDRPSSLTVRDVNRDGRPDVLVTNSGDNTLSLILNRFDPNQVWSYQPTAIDPDGDPVQFELTAAPGGMLLDSTTGKIYWAPMPEQVGRSNVVLTATDGRGGATEQGFAVTVTAPAATAAPVFTSSPVTAFGADQIYRYQPNVQSDVAGSLRYSLVEAPVGMTIDPGTGTIQWDARSNGLKLVDNLNGFAGPIQNSNFGQFEIPDAPIFHSASVTVEGWFNFSDPRAAVFEPLLAKEATTSRNESSWGLEYFYGTIRARVGRADGSVLALVTAPAPVTFEKWTHLAMTFDDATKTLTLFVDGQAVASAVSPEAIGYTNMPVYSGANMMTTTRLRVWSYARSATEIAANQLAHVPSNSSGLVLDLGMNESADAVTLLDSSPAKNNGTLLGVPDFFRFPKRLPTLADSGSRPVRIRVEDGRGGFAEQSFTVTSQLPYKTNVSGFVYDDLNANGKWDHRLGENLVLNGDFSSRNQAFETDFLVREQSGGGWMTDGQATVSNSSSAVPLTGDNQGHTYGNASDLMLVANGGATDKVVWRQSIATQSGTNYSFSYWAMRPNNYDAARLQVRLNGQSFGTILNTADVGPATYLQFKSDFVATSDLSTLEIVLLGSLTAPNPSLLSAENAVAIDDVLLVEAAARRAIVSGKANPYLAGMPNGSTALGSTAPVSSPPSVSVTSGEVLRFNATGQVLSQGFIMGPSADGRADTINIGALNGLSGLQLPVTGALVGVFLSDESPANQSAPATLDFRNGGNVPGGVNYQSLAPALRQLFFIGDGKNDQGVEQTITVPAGATRLMLASGASSSWDNSRGTFDVQILTGVSEPTQSGRVIYVDSNFNNRWDAGETTATTNARGLYTIASPGASARFGLVQKVGSVQAFPSTPFQVSGTLTSAAMQWATHDVPSDAGPRFLTQPAPNAGIVDLSAPTVYTFQAFAQAGDGEPVSYSLASAPAEMFIDRVSGLLRWNPRATDAGEHDVMIKAIDSAGRFAMQRFTLRVTANSSPIIVSTPHTNAIRQVPYEYRLRAQDAEQRSLLYELITAPVGMTIDADTGIVRWTPDAIGTNNVVVRVSDRAGGAVEQSWIIDTAASGSNHAPTLDAVDQWTVVVNRRFGLLLNAQEPDHDALIFALISGPAGLTVSTGGVLTWTPSDVGPFEAVVRVTDSRGLSDTKTLHFISEAKPPASSLTITSVPITAAVTDELYSYDVKAAAGNAFELLTKPDGMSIDAVRGTIRWRPTKDHLGVQTVKLRVSDSFGNTVTQSFSLTVRSSSIVPTISSAPPTEAAVGQTLVYAVELVNPSRSPITFSLSAAPNGMTIDSQSGVITWTPSVLQVGSATVVIRAADAVGNYSSQSFAISVSAGSLNRPPVITSSASLDAIVGQTYTYTLQGSDPDGSSLTYAVRSAPAGLTVQSTTGLVSWNPQAADVGSVNVVLTAVDPQGGAAVQSLVIQVRPANQAPVIRSAPTLKVSQGGLYQYDVFAADPDREPLFYELTDAPIGMTVDALGRVRWQTQLDTPLGARQVVVRVHDGLGAAVTQSYTFAVVADTQAPRLAIITGGEPVLYPWTTAPAIVRVIASDDVQLASVQLKVDGEPVELAADGTVRVFFKGAGLGRLEAIATDAAGNIGRAIGRVSMRSGEEDGSGNPAPESAITSIGQGANVSGMIDVIGTAAAPDFASYSLSYRRADETQFTTIRTSTTTVTAASLGKWDTTLLENDNYVLKLEVVDTFGSLSAVEVEVSVTGRMKLGDYRLSFEDMTIPVAGIPLTIARTYDSLTASKSGDFGYGWRMEFRNADLRTSLPKSGLEDIGIFTPFKSGTRVFITLPGGERQGFTFSPEIHVLPGFGFDSFLVLASPRFTPDKGVRSTLSAGGGSLTVNEFGELFAAGGIPWNPASPDFGGYRLTTADDTEYAIDGSTGKMTSATDRNGNRVEFSDSAVKASNGDSISIRRDAAGRIVDLVDPAGKVIHYAYSTSGDLLSVTDRMGNVTQYRYRTTSHYLEQVIDPLGRVGSRVEYDASGRLSRAIDGAGNATTVSYDIDNALVSATDPLGHVTTSEFDARGNVVQVIDAAGSSSKFAYDDSNQVTSQTDALGNITTFVYDVRGNVTEKTDALGNTTRSAYDRFGNLLSDVDGLGRSRVYQYDARGNLLSSSNAAGVTTTVTTAGFGLVGQVNNGYGRQFAFQYDGSGKATGMTDARGLAVDMVYDNVGQLLERRYTTTLGTQSVPLSEKRSYDANGRLIAVTDVDGGTERYEYDATGRQTATVDKLGRRTTVDYDVAGRKTDVRYPDGSHEHYAYDAAGRLVVFTDTMNRDTRYEYDSVGRRITTIYPDDTPATLADNPRTRSEYDAVGNMIATTDETGLRRTTAYDALARPIRVVEPGGAQTTTEYDAVGNRTVYTDALGRKTRYEYDELNHLIETISADGRTVKQEFNDLGLRGRTVDATGASTIYEYGGDGRLTAVVDALGNRTSYRRDNRGELVETIDANGSSTVIVRDALGREVSKRLPGGQLFTTQYDAVGNVIRTVDADGNEIRYEYDVRDRVTKKTVGSAVTTTTYSASGMVLTTIDARGTTTYQYDARDRLVRQVEPDGQVLQMTFDAAGRRLSLVAAGKTQQFTYDNAGRMASVRDGDGNTTAYIYDAVGSLIETDYPNSVIEHRTYNDVGELIRITASRGLSVLTDFRYSLDAGGRVTQRIDADGRTTDYRYDAAGRLTTEIIRDGSSDHAMEYQFDAVGNRLRKIDSVEGTTNYVYDINDRLLSSEHSGVTMVYSYNASGDLLSAVSPTERLTNTWSAEHRLLKTTRVQGATTDTEETEYDDRGNRVSVKNTSGEKRRYLLDTSGALSQIVAELAANGVVLASYTRGLELVSINRGSGAETYLADRLGSVRLIVNPNGTPKESFAYDAYGILLNGNIGDGAARYTGEPISVTSNYTYLRARYYDSETGRFISTDPFAGIESNPISLQRYVYAYVNPTNLTDPSGQSPDTNLASISAALSIISTVSAVGSIVANIGGYSDVAYWLDIISYVSLFGSIATHVGGLVLQAGPGAFKSFLSRVGGLSVKGVAQAGADASGFAYRSIIDRAIAATRSGALSEGVGQTARALAGEFSSILSKELEKDGFRLVKSELLPIFQSYGRAQVQAIEGTLYMTRTVSNALADVFVKEFDKELIRLMSLLR